jgi:hypothetical protein
MTTDGGTAPIPDPHLAGWLRQADAVLVSHLAEIDQLASINQASAGIEVARLTARYGPGSPRVIEATSRLQAEALLRSDVESEVARAKLPVPSADPGTAVIHGRVLNGTEPYKGAKVTAVDEKNRPVASATTDGRGYFELTLPAKRSGSRARVTDATQADATGSRGVRLVVADANDNVILEDRETFVTPVGTVLYRELAVGQTDASGASPV